MNPQPRRLYMLDPPFVPLAWAGYWREHKRLQIERLLTQPQEMTGERFWLVRNFFGMNKETAAFLLNVWPANITCLEARPRTVIDTEGMDFHCFQKICLRSLERLRAHES